MAADKYSAVWVSHSSISDFLKCPRLYYLRNVYKDPKTGHKVALMAPALALGQSVHEVVESLSVLPTNTRFDEPLAEKFEKVWQKVSGIKGGFRDSKTELTYKNRGLAMLRRVQNNPGPLKALAVKIKMDLPHFWLSESDNIILCGKIDWLEYLQDTDSVHVIDFKTSKNHEEDGDSLQLPIYHLLVYHCQKRNVERASYWYLERSDDLTPKELPDIIEAEEKVLSIARKIKLARQLQKFDCPNGPEGCFACKPYELIVGGQAEFVGENEFRQDLYIMKEDLPQEEDSVIL